MEYICTICTESLEFGQEKPGSIPCGHTFHTKCLETWLKIASKCPVCSASTCITQIKGPLYFSSHRDGLKGKSNAELELLLLEITRKRQRDKDCLRESRIANKYLTGELKKYKRIIQTPQVTAQEAEVNYLKMLYCELQKAQECIKSKDAQLLKAQGDHKKLTDKLTLELAKTQKAKREREEANASLQVVKTKLASTKSEIIELKNQLNVTRTSSTGEISEYKSKMKNQENELQILNAKYSALKENYKKYHEQFKRLKDGGVILIKREAKTPVVVSGSTSSKNSSGKPGRSGKPTVSFSLPTNVKS